jgi:hypothetical protein
MDVSEWKASAEQISLSWTLGAQAQADTDVTTDFAFYTSACMSKGGEMSSSIPAGLQLIGGGSKIKVARSVMTDENLYDSDNDTVSFCLAIRLMKNNVFVNFAELDIEIDGTPTLTYTIGGSGNIEPTSHTFTGTSAVSVSAQGTNCDGDVLKQGDSVCVTIVHYAYSDAKISSIQTFTFVDDSGAEISQPAFTNGVKDEWTTALKCVGDGGSETCTFNTLLLGKFFVSGGSHAITATGTVRFVPNTRLLGGGHVRALAETGAEIPIVSQIHLEVTPSDQSSGA